MEIPEGPPSYANPREREAIEAAIKAIMDYSYYERRIGAYCLSGSVRLSEGAYIAIMHYKLSMQSSNKSEDRK